MHKKLVITLWIVLGAIYAISQANVVLNFPDINLYSLENKFSLVHFMAPGNDFVGSIFRLPSTSITGINISINSGAEIKTGCTKQLRGLYFNSQRGKRIRPLDQETLTLLGYSDIEIEWGLYTTCENTSPYNIFWAITYTWSGTTKSYLVAGTKYHYQQNEIDPHFAKSFQYFDNKIPIGYIYDSNGGIWFVGGKLSGHQSLITYLNSGGSINSGFTYSWSLITSNTWWRSAEFSWENNAMETMRRLIIEGSVGLSKSMDAKERIFLLGNFQNKTVIYNGSDINSSTVINFAKQKAQELCQGKQKNILPLSMNTENVACYENTDLTINLASNEYANKTIIIKNGNVHLQNSMTENSSAIDLFIDKWILYLPETFTFQTFNNEGFPNPLWTTQWLYLKGNFVINGIMIGSGNTTFEHKLHLQGKTTFLNTPLQANVGRTDQIHTLLGTGYAHFINLQNIFTRTCKLDGTANDGTSCDWDSIIASTPIVILNGNYPSNILQ